MKYYKYSIFILIFVLIASATSFAQKDYARTADDAFEDQQYIVAIERYKKAYTKVKSNKTEKNRISYQLAECYRLINNTRRAESQYKRLVKANYDKKEPLILLYYADALKANKKYDLALIQYNAYSEVVPDDKRGPDGAESAVLSKEWEENPTKYEIENIKKLNSREADFSPAYGSENYNSLIFTSTREGATGKATDEWTDQNFSDLFTARLDRKEEWSTPVLLDTKEDGINTESNEGTPVLNAKFNSMYFTRCPNEDKKICGCQIYKSKRIGRSWGDPEIIMLGNDTNAAIGHPAFSENELIIYFASDRPGGFGGKDIWVAFRDTKEEEFGRPQNIGPVVNTAGDEMFPYLRSDTVLYFASNGHIGMGGLDILITTIDEEGKWAKPENLKYPINSNNDDFAIIFHPEKEEGYFSSNRKGGKGKEDIYYFIIPPVEFTLTGIVKDDRTLQYVPGAWVELVGSDGISVSTKTNSKGIFNFGKSQVLPNTNYDIIVSKDDYFTTKGSETTVGLERSKDFERDFMLQPIPEEPILLPEILYDLAKWDLKPQYEDSLQGLIKTLDANETITIELASHTDARDTDERNDILSQKRAQSVVDYLILRGIDPDRLGAKGYGEKIPRKLKKEISREGFTFTIGTDLTEEYIASLSTEAEKEAAHQLNRRTEFAVLNKDYIPKPKNIEITSEVEIQINPEENIVKYTEEDKTGAIQAKCLINGYYMQFTYDRNVPAQISLRSALILLNKGAISKSDFKGEVTKVLAEGSIANNAVFTIKELRIASKTINDIDITVNHKLKQSLILGDDILSKFGNYIIDDQQKIIVFTYKE